MVRYTTAVYKKFLSLIVIQAYVKKLQIMFNFSQAYKFIDNSKFDVGICL